MQKDRTYVCIDLKSFYASVECRERGLDPMTTNLVVADPERSDKTICLAVSPAMKKLGVPGRCRVFEIPKGIEYIMAPPRMQLYIDYSAEIYAIYLKYISKEDIHVYSIDEVFMDVTDYLAMYQMSAKELSVRIMEDILEHTGITATAGIGTNLYLAKVALDITAKHVEDHIGILDEESYCKTLWNHKPLTDFWRIGKGIANRLEQSGIRTIGEIAHADEDMLYRMFGVDAELLIDHAWGRESTTMQDIKSYRPKTNSLSSGQVLECDYTFEKGKLVVKEMADLLCLELVEKGLVTDSITLHVGYSNRLEKKPAHGTIGLRNSTSSARQIIAATEKLYCQIVDPYTSVRRMTVTFNQVVDEQYQQYDLFTDPAELEREHRMQEAILDIKEKFGKNAILKGIDLQAGATTMERNRQIGGHKSGT
jgi:nucleotidyltransferase/DNA polymerase involved in DNA repair